VMKALAQAVPKQVSAGIGNLRVVALSGLNHGNHWVHMEIMEGSYGGRFGKDGMDAVDTLYANTRNNPIEDIETHVPIRVERYELREEAMAPGEWRGGIGAIREFRFLSDAGFSIEGDGHAYAPWGFQDGAEGFTASLTLITPDGTECSLPSKVPYARVKAGDRLISVGPSGGGYGAPSRRDPQAVARDVADGLISLTTALGDYGVTIRADGTGERR
jgi:N-methylhydantoinase B